MGEGTAPLDNYRRERSPRACRELYALSIPLPRVVDALAVLDTLDASDTLDTLETMSRKSGSVELLARALEVSTRALDTFGALLEKRLRLHLSCPLPLAIRLPLAPTTTPSD